MKRHLLKVLLLWSLAPCGVTEAAGPQPCYFSGAFVKCFPANGLEIVQVTYDGSSSGSTILKATAAASGTLTLPAATDTLVGKATTDTLTNKTLSSAVVTSAGLGFDGASSGQTKIAASAAAGSTTLTLPAATDTLVGKATTDTLTNKTLSGNTATNLVSGSGTLTLNTSGTMTVPNQTTTIAGINFDNAFTNKQTITAAAAQVGLVVNGVSGQYAGSFSNGAAAGSSRGLNVQAGGNSSDVSAAFQNRSGTDLLVVRGDGAITINTNNGLGGNVPHNCTRVVGTASGSGGTSATATCATSQIVTGGGCSVSTSAGALGLIESYPSTFTTGVWTCSRLAAAAGTMTAFAICCDY